MAELDDGTLYHPIPKVPKAENYGFLQIYQILKQSIESHFFPSSCSMDDPVWWCLDDPVVVP